MMANDPVQQSGANITDLYQEVERLLIQVEQSKQAVAELRRRSDIQEAQNQMPLLQNQDRLSNALLLV